MEGDEQQSPSLPENTKLEGIAESVVLFQQFVYEVLEAVEQDENFHEMTAESYDQKKSYIKSHLEELSLLHNSLADQYADLIEEVSKYCPSLIQDQHLQSSDSSSSPQVTQTLAPKFSTATGYDVLWHPGGGGFYLYKGKGSSHSSVESSMSSVNKPPLPPVNYDALKVKETKDPDCGGTDFGSESSVPSINKPPVPPVNDDALKIKETKDPDCGGSDSGSESSVPSVNKPPVPPVNDDALKVKETKDPGCGGSDSGSESSMSSVNKPLVPPVNDDAFKADKTNEVLLENISNLEEQVVSLKQKIQCLRKENGKLKQEIEDNITDIREYMSESKLEMKTMEEQLQASKEFAKKIDEHMCKIVAEKLNDQSKHDSEIIEMNMKMNQYTTEISQLKSTHEKKEKIWNGVTEQLKYDLEKKCEFVEELSKNIEDLIIDKSSQNHIIHQLQIDLNAAKFENVGVLPSFDNVQKLTDELKLKVVELEKEVDRQREAFPDRDRE